MPERTLAALLSALRSLYGSPDLCASDTGIVHVVSCARAESGSLRVLRVDQGSPESETDFLVLNLCRARADAVLTTARNLRREPGLSHRLAGPWAGALAELRRELLKKTAPLCCAILTRSGRLPEDHPVWGDGTQKLILTEPAQASALHQQFGQRAEVLAVPNLSARTACALLERRGATTISVEAGPTTASILYQVPSLVDELLLTTCEAALPPHLLGEALPDDGQLLSGLTRVACTARTERGVPFRFERFRRVTKGEAQG